MTDHIEQTHQLITELRSTIESKTAHLSENKEKVERLEKALDKLEDNNDKVVAQLKAAEKAELEAKERMNDLEAQIARMPSNSEGFKQVSQDMKFFEACVKEGPSSFAVKEFGADLSKKYLRSDSNVDGGFLVPVDYYNQIIKKITEISPIRAISRSRNVSSGSLKVPVRNTLMSALWTGEASSGTASNSTYAQKEIFAKKLTGETDITLEELQDAMFDMESEITQDMAEQFAYAEGAAFVNGPGVERPFGFLQNSLVQNWNSGFTNSFDFDALVDIAGQLKTGYNPVWVMNRRTLAYVRKLKDGVGQYLWQPSVVAGQPNMIEGYSYVSAIDMPDVGAGTVPVAFGDFMRGYLIVDKPEIVMVRDQYSKIRQGIVSFIMHRRTGGDVILPEALKFLKCSTDANTNQ